MLCPSGERRRPHKRAHGPKVEYISLIWLGPLYAEKAVNLLVNTYAEGGLVEFQRGIRSFARWRRWPWLACNPPPFITRTHNLFTPPPFDQDRKISPKRKFWGRISRGHPGVMRADIPAQKLRSGPSKYWTKNKHLGTDITSMTQRRGRPRNFCSLFE